jgi:hypothetical protein
MSEFGGECYEGRYLQRRGMKRKRKMKIEEEG